KRHEQATVETSSRLRLDLAAAALQLDLARLMLGPREAAVAALAQPAIIRAGAVNGRLTRAGGYECARQCRIDRMPCWTQLSNIDSDASAMSSPSSAAMNTAPAELQWRQRAGRLGRSIKVPHSLHSQRRMLVVPPRFTGCRGPGHFLDGEPGTGMQRSQSIGGRLATDFR